MNVNASAPPLEVKSPLIVTVPTVFVSCSAPLSESMPAPTTVAPAALMVTESPAIAALVSIVEPAVSVSAPAVAVKPADATIAPEHWKVTEFVNEFALVRNFSSPRVLY